MYHVHSLQVDSKMRLSCQIYMYNVHKSFHGTKELAFKAYLTPLAPKVALPIAYNLDTDVTLSLIHI